MMKATGNTILLRLSIHWAISCGVIVVKLCNCARVALRGKGFGDDVLLTLVMLSIEHFWSSSILTEGMLRVLGKLCKKVYLLWKIIIECFVWNFLNLSHKIIYIFTCTVR